MLLRLVHLPAVWGKLLCQSYFWFQWKLSDEDGAFEQLGFEGAAGRLTGGSLPSLTLRALPAACRSTESDAVLF